MIIFFDPLTVHGCLGKSYFLKSQSLSSFFYTPSLCKAWKFGTFQIPELRDWDLVLSLSPVRVSVHFCQGD